LDHGLHDRQAASAPYGLGIALCQKWTLITAHQAKVESGCVKPVWAQPMSAPDAEPVCAATCVGDLYRRTASRPARSGKCLIRLGFGKMAQILLDLWDGHLARISK
jgi:hypothetical protein